MYTAESVVAASSPIDLVVSCHVHMLAWHALHRVVTFILSVKCHILLCAVPTLLKITIATVCATCSWHSISD